MKIDVNASAYAAQARNNMSPNLDAKDVERGNIDTPKAAHQENSAALAVHEKQQTAHTLFYAQKIASAESADDAETSSAVQDFLDYMDKSTAEKWRERILSSMGLTEESLEAMSAEDRQEIEEKIAQIIEQKIEEDARENNKNGAVQKLQTAVERHGESISQLSLSDKEELSKLSDNVLQMIDLPAEVESLYKQEMSQDSPQSGGRDDKK